MTDQERLIFESLRATSELAKQISSPAARSDAPKTGVESDPAHDEHHDASNEEPGHACRKQSTGKCCGGCRKP